MNFELAELVENARHSPGQFAVLYRLYLKRIYAYILGMVRNHHDAEDLCSEAFISASQNMNQLRNPNHFGSWLFSIARNKSMDFLRKANKDDQRMADENLAFENLIVLPNGNNENALLVRELLRTLSQEDKELILWKYFAELTFSEIAEIVHWPVSTVKSRVYSILKKLNASLEGSNGR